MRSNESKNPTDGVDGLRRRERTRLWYRAVPPADRLREVARPAGAASAPATDADAAARSGPAQPGRVALEAVFLLERSVLTAAAVAAAAPAADPVAALTGWQTVPANAPTLLLSASPLLDGRTRGPILGPGRRYRIVDVEDGVVGLVVAGANGATMPGYCNAVDLSCVAPLFAGLRTKGGRGRPQTAARQRLARFGQGIGTVAGSFLGGSAGAESRLF